MKLLYLSRILILNFDANVFHRLENETLLIGVNVLDNKTSNLLQLWAFAVQKLLATIKCTFIDLNILKGYFKTILGIVLLKKKLVTLLFVQGIIFLLRHSQLVLDHYFLLRPSDQTRNIQTLMLWPSN
jgi:hypothetical protein